MTSRGSRRDWIQFDCRTHAMVCTRCKVRKPLGLPIKIHALIGAIDDFTANHKNCKEHNTCWS